MDLYNYEKNSNLFDESKKKKLGYLKDEYGGKIVNEFVGLKSKLYSIDYGNHENKKTAKGLQKVVLNKKFNHSHYKNVIEHNNIYYSSMKRIQSKDQKINTVELEKLIFTPFDDKRYILDEGIHTLPFGHRAITY